MSSRSRITQGMRGGLLAGATVAVFFLVRDFIFADPLTTPTVLSDALLGAWNTSEAAGVVDVALVGGHLLTFTVIHLATFGLLGIGAAAVFDRYQVPLTIWSGAAFGLVAFSAAYTIGLAMAGGAIAVGAPGPEAVVAANLLAGGVMGGYMEVCA